ncbi:MAG: hypothetical protein GX560_01335 [Deinococcales bacterium]|nr:hypothetical protein [Deinococcales bacterium]
MTRLRRLALAALLALLPLPLSSLAALAERAALDGEGTAGMAARPTFVVEAAVRVPALSSASVASRLALPTDPVAATPRPEAWHAGAAQRAPPPEPGVRLALLGRRLLDGG